MMLQNKVGFGYLNRGESVSYAIEQLVSRYTVAVAHTECLHL